MDPYLTSPTKINLKWIKDLNVRPETIKFLEGNISRMIFDLGLSNILLNMSPQARETKAKINTWNYIKLKSFDTVKEPTTKWKSSLLNGRRYLPTAYLIMDYYTKYKELI